MCYFSFFFKFILKQKHRFIRMKKVHPLAYYLCRDLNHTFGNAAPTNQIFTKKLGVRCWIGGRSQPSDPLEKARKNGGQRVGVIRASVNTCHYFRECGSFMNTASWWRPKQGKCGTEGTAVLTYPTPGVAVQT